MTHKQIAIKLFKEEFPDAKIVQKQGNVYGIIAGKNIDFCFIPMMYAIPIYVEVQVSHEELKKIQQQNIH